MSGKGPGSQPMWRRPLGVTGIVVAGLLVFGIGIGNARAGIGDPSERSGIDVPAAPRARTSEASGVRSAPDEERPAETSTPQAVATPKHRRATRPRPRTYLVVRVVDGDTIDLGNGQTVRLVGIDTPERGECGSERAGDNLARLVLGKRVRLAMSDEDTDRYGRLLRYVDIERVDAGLAQIKQGYAVARYDSRDGYGFHPREPSYVRADRASKPYTCSKARPAPLVGGGGADCMTGYSPCLAVVEDLDCGEISGPVRVTGSDPYRLDADGDGIGCDT